MADQRRAGLIQVQVDGVTFDAKGNFTYNLGGPKRDEMIGADGVHGFKEVPQAPYLEGAFTDRGDLSLQKLIGIVDSTVTLQLSNGKVFVLRNAWYSGDGQVSTEESEIKVKFCGKSGEEV